MRLSCALATSSQTPDHVATAEQLGYERAWLYDSPALYTDVWMMLMQAAARTTTIGIGPAVLVPSLRHPMVNAAAIATLVDAAPGRVAVAVGAGFTGRFTLGQKPMRWADVERYIEVLRGLLRGDTVTWDGRAIRMMQPSGFGAPRPIDVPILIGADGPKATAVADRVGDGIFAAGRPNAHAPAGCEHILLQFGTVISPGEDLRSRRVLDAAGHAVALLYHAFYEAGGADAVGNLPGGADWVEAVEATPADQRHLETHQGHLVHLTPHDEVAVRAAADLIPQFSLSGPPHEIRDRLAAVAAAGVTEIAYQPAGTDIPGELERMAAAVRGA